MISSKYDFSTLEPQIYAHWEKHKYFTPKIDPKKEPFSVIMPPPNANGSLHIGHAMFVTLEDIMTRYARMQGKAALMVPGADHAGILTQVVFERELKKKDLSRYDLGREKFVQQCLAFTKGNKDQMYAQLKTLGASADWSRAAFTLDPDVSKQVIETFVQMHGNRMIYRSEQLINWCPRCMTALSNLEVEYHEVNGNLYFIQYPLTKKADNTGQTRFIIVATTRPETMLGDTGVAIHPDDKRYRQFIGGTIQLPFTHREIPIIADKAVDPEFGTGVVKITPAHDPNDFEMAKRHGLGHVQVIDYNNKMAASAGVYAGSSVLLARQAIIEELKKKDLLVNVKKYTHQVGHCERCKTIIQPQISLQWFVDVKPLIKPAIAAVKEQKTKIIPKRFEKTYFQWMDNLHDWCISRQLWWGHQIPVYYCGLKGLSQLQQKMNPDLAKKHRANAGCGYYIVSATPPQTCPKCHNTALIRDPDTLDTWYSSGQWPYTTLSSKSKFKANSSKLIDENPKSDFNYFYPTSVMETGYEILFFWVARMMMLGLYRTGEVPFKTVYLHGLVRDAFGEKMSKSKGNVINPLDIIAKFGADALRMALVVGATPGNDLSIGEPKIKGYRNFTNKIWNISRFVLLNAQDKPLQPLDKLTLTAQDKALVKKVETLIKRTTKYLDNHRYSLAGEKLYNFVWHELADNYIESSKERIHAGETVVLSVLMHTLRVCLKLLHPYIPFVTEAIWQELPDRDEPDLIMAKWPTL